MKEKGKRGEREEPYHLQEAFDEAMGNSTTGGGEGHVKRKKKKKRRRRAHFSFTLREEEVHNRFSKATR